MKEELQTLAGLDFCYLTTTGRRSGLERTIEIWFGLDGNTLYFLSGSGDSAGWVRNLEADPRVRVRLGRRTFPGKARIVHDQDEDSNVRRLLATKYQGWEPGRRLSSWARYSLPVAVDLVTGRDKPSTGRPGAPARRGGRARAR